jgi:hypothetical protein
MVEVAEIVQFWGFSLAKKDSIHIGKNLRS